jgi:hypothetical protein
MYEREPAEKAQRDLDSRLEAYYGPELREQPLPESAWLQLRSSLHSPRASGRLHLHPPRWYIRRFMRRSSMHRSSERTPAHIQQAFTRILHESRMPLQSVRLQSTFASNIKAPRVRIAPLRRRKIRLVLPSNPTWSIDPAALDVLLATALARYYYQRKPAAILTWLLLVAALLGCVGAFLFLPRTATNSIILIVIIIGLGIAFVGVSHVRGYSLAFRADTLMVRWLGRTRVCQGLHSLADRERSQRRWRWREPSLAERIDRVCGSRVAIEDEHLTLVR